MKIAIIVEPRYLRQEITQAILRILRDLQVAADVLCTQDCHFEPDTGHVRTESGQEFDLSAYDVVISRSRNALGLAMLAYLEAAGVPCINSYRAVQRARNKADVALALGPAGVPCAPTILADRTSVLAELPGEWYPLILKSTFGDNSQGLRLIRRPEELLDVRWGDELALAQHYVPNDGYDLKLYVCGGQVFGMRKPSPLNADPGAAAVPIEPDAAMRRVALACGSALGLEIYGVDAIATPDGPLVIEVNEFPNFTQVPGAAACITAYIVDRVRARPRAGAAAPIRMHEYVARESRAWWTKPWRIARANRLSAASV
jgi:ribosomal protein S6--L-glutamate ligase